MCRHGLLVSCVFLYLSLTSTPIPAQPEGGPEFQINSYTTSAQERPAVGVDASGRFVVTWQSSGSAGNDTSDGSIQVQRFSADGTPLGMETQVNTYTVSWQRNPKIGVEPDGDFVIVWQSNYSASDSSGLSVLGQRFASDGTPRGGEFRIGLSHTQDDQAYPVVAVEDDGDFVMVWQSESSTGTDQDGWSAQAQRYASDGTRRGQQFQINTYTTGDQIQPWVASEADGDFVIAWKDSPRVIKAQRFASDGTPQADHELDIGVPVAAPSAEIGTNGEAVVAWGAQGSEGSGLGPWSIQAQRFASDGSLLGSIFQVNSFTPVDQLQPAVSIEPDGDFAVVWQSRSSAGLGADDWTIKGRRFASDGTARGEDFQVNLLDSGGQQRPGLAATSNSFFVVWESPHAAGNDSGSSIAGRIFSELFSDGFESGDTSAWQDPGP